jgi:hypothetical protein
MASSISSMTGGSRVAEGPTMKITSRTDKDFILKQTASNKKPSDFDVSTVSALFVGCCLVVVCDVFV